MRALLFVPVCAAASAAEFSTWAAPDVEGRPADLAVGLAYLGAGVLDRRARPGQPPGAAGRAGRRRPVVPAESARTCGLTHLAEGRSNDGIAAALHITPRTVETHIGEVFAKLGLDADGTTNRRVLAAVAYLKANPSPHT